MCSEGKSREGREDGQKWSKKGLGNSFTIVMMGNFMCQPGRAKVPRYVVQRYSGSSGEGAPGGKTQKWILGLQLRPAE